LSEEIGLLSGEPFWGDLIGVKSDEKFIDIMEKE